MIWAVAILSVLLLASCCAMFYAWRKHTEIVVDAEQAAVVNNENAALKTDAQIAENKAKIDALLKAPEIVPEKPVHTTTEGMTDEQVTEELRKRGVLP